MGKYSFTLTGGENSFTSTSFPLYFAKKMMKLWMAIESLKFVSHRARMLAEFDSRKDSQSTKFE